MEPLAAARILNDLLAVESLSLLPSLGRMTVFISSASADEADIVDSMIQDERQHEQWLVDAILDLGGYPNPVRASAAVGGLHYVELRALLPMALREKRNIIDRYQRAQDALASMSRCASLAATILERHRRHAEQLEQMIHAAPHIG